MPSIHEFDVALQPGVPSPATVSRSMAREIHLNVWQSGVKGGGQFGNFGSLTQTGIGLVLSVSRPSAALSNSPSEFILGSTQAAPGLLNLAEIAAVDSASGTNFNIIAIP